MPPSLRFLLTAVLIRSIGSLPSPGAVSMPWEHFSLTQINLSLPLPNLEPLLNTSIHSFSSHPTSPSSSPSPSHSSHFPLCVSDSIQVAWNTSQIHPSSVHLAFIVDREWDGYSTPLSLVTLPNTTPPINPIQCDVNEDHCVLTVKEVFVKDKKLYLEFDKPTNQAELLSTSRLNVGIKGRCLVSHHSFIGSFVDVSNHHRDCHWCLANSVTFRNHCTFFPLSSFH